MKTNKYRYVYVVQGNYGYGWDDLTESESYRDARRDFRDYRDNEPFPHRIVKRRIRKEVAA